MFSVVTRGAYRQAIRPAMRCMASAPPPRPPPSAQENQPESQEPSKAQESAQPQAADEPPKLISSLPSLDFVPSEDGSTQKEAGGRRTGAKSSRDSMSSIERRRQGLARVSLGLCAIGALAGVLLLGNEWTADELKKRKQTLEQAPATRWARTKARLLETTNYFSEPAWEELLPPPLPAPHQKPYTLLLSLDDLLVTSTWDRQYGWRTAKRPGVDYFLAYLSQFYEIVIFTTQQHYTALPILEKLDPYNFFITYKLFRDATRSTNGKTVKDLSYLNRDLSKVVLLDTHEEHVSTHPENSIVLPKWTGESRDRGLVAMIPFLESIAIYKTSDVRPILTAYQGKDIPLEYGKKEAEAKERHIEEWKAKGASGFGGGLKMSTLFGGEAKPSPIPPTYLEQRRGEAQRLYKEEQAYIAANKHEFERLLEEDRQAMAREMSGSLWGMLDGMGGKKPEAPAPASEAPAPASATAAAAVGVQQPKA